MLALTAFALGLRHGVDWDHLAAIGDIAGSQPRRRAALVLSTLYALGHAAVVLALGAVAVVAGGRLPEAVDRAMGRVVGATLVVLGGAVVVGLVRNRGRVRLRSRWTVVIGAAQRAVAALPRRGRPAPEVVEVAHAHPHDHGPGEEHEHNHAHTHAARAVAAGGGRPLGHDHPHRHAVALPADPFPPYRRSVAVAVGALHGVGAETPTQLVVLGTAAGAGGRGDGAVVLAAFLAGLLVSNTAVAVAATFGLLGGRDDQPSPWRVALVGATGLVSLAYGMSLLAA